MKKLFSIVSVCAFISLSVSSVQAAEQFPDVHSDYIYSQAIQFLKDRGVVNGFPDGTFGPERLITRAELLKIALEGAKVDTSNYASKSSPFPDLSDDHSLRRYVIYAYEKHIVSGYPDGTYRPNQPTTRGEAIKMLLNINETELSPITTAFYRDTALDNPLASFVYEAREQKIIPYKYNADNAGIDEQIIRGEVGEMMYRLLYVKERGLDQFPEILQNPSVVLGDHPVDVFQGVTLQSPLPKTAIAETFYPISVTTNAGLVKLLVQNASGKKWLWEYKVAQGKANFDLIFPEAGIYDVAILPDTAGDRVWGVKITVLSDWQVSGGSLTPPANPEFAIDDTNQTWLSWDNNAENAVLKLACEQGARRVTRFIVANSDKWQLDYQIFSGFVEGSITCHLAQAQRNTSWISTLNNFEEERTWAFSALQHHFRTWEKNKLAVDNLPLFTNAPTLRFSGESHIDLSNYAEVINPDGSVDVFPLEDNETGTLPSDRPWSLSIEFSQSGVYFFEINDVEGIAVLNTPIYKGVTGVPVLPDFMDMQVGVVLETKVSLTNSAKNDMRSDLLQRINEVRARQGKSQIILDEQLNDFAQSHVDDMVASNYFSHRDQRGRGPDERKADFGITLPVGENIAFSVDIPSIDAGLRRSAVHLLNMLDGRWIRVGIGLSYDQDGLLYVVEEFSTRSFVTTPMTVGEKAELKQRTLDRINTNRTAVGLTPLMISHEYDAALATWAANPRTESLRNLLLDAGLTTGRLINSEGEYSSNLPAELALQTAVTVSNLSKMNMDIAFEGETMLVAMVLY